MQLSVDVGRQDHRETPRLQLIESVPTIHSSYPVNLGTESEASVREDRLFRQVRQGGVQLGRLLEKRERGSREQRRGENPNERPI